MSAPSPEEPGSDSTADNTLVILTPAPPEETRQLITRLLSSKSETTFELSTRYYTTHVSIETYQVSPDGRIPQLSTDCLSSAPAIVTIASQVSHIPICKRGLRTIGSHAREDATKLFVVTDDAYLDVIASYELVKWAVTINVEVLTQAVCRDDGVSLSNRVRDALQCANWQLQRPDEEELASCIYASAADKRDDDDGDAADDSDNDVFSDNTDDDFLQLSSAVMTHRTTPPVREGEPDDISRLMQKLLRSADDD